MAKEKLKMKELTLEVTNRCVQRCIHCSSMSCYEDETTIPLDMCIEVVTDSCEIGLERLNISGGEPFLYGIDNLEKLVYHVNHVLKKKCYLYSCGILGTPDKPTSIPYDYFERLYQAGLTKIIMSLHGVGKMYDTMTTVVDGMKYMDYSIRNAVRSGLEVESHFVPTTKNIDEFEDVLTYLNSIGVYKTSVLRLVPQGRATEDLVPSYDRMVELLEYVDTVVPVKFPNMVIRKGHPLKEYGYKCDEHCQAAIGKLVVMATGDIIPCEAFKWMVNGTNLRHMMFGLGCKESNIEVED